jgi:molybdopterin molybdotransferase
MLTVTEALALVQEQAKPIAPRRLHLSEAAGLVLAEDVASDVDSPPHDKAMMDGYAVDSSDIAPVRQVIEEIAAGVVPRLAITSGTAARIMTGAPMPAGADTVIPVEQTEMLENGCVQLGGCNPRQGQNVLPRAASVRAGDIVVREGALIRPVEIGILAEVGRAIVAVRPRPRVAVLSTGNELVQIAERPGPGQIRNSNGSLLVAVAGAAGAEPVDLGIARDEIGELRDGVRRGLAADVFVLSGGVSAGKFDFVPQVLSEAGVRQVFHKVALRPGRPLWFGVWTDSNERTLVFGLPGNPVSSFVCFELFVRPAIAGLAGRGFAGNATMVVSLQHAYDHAGGRAACLPGRISTSEGTNGQTIEILSWGGSADMAALTRANALVQLPAEPMRLPAGTPVTALMI